MRSDAGLTVIELLVALTITTLLLTAVYRTVTATGQARVRTEAGNAAHHRARLLADRLDRELLSLATGNDSQTWLSLSGRSDQQELVFTSYASTPLAGQPGMPARIDYSLRRAEEDEAGPYVLQRGEASALALDPQKPQRFFDGVKTLHLQCLVNGVWVDTFTPSGQQKQPQAVSFQLETADGYSFRSAFTVAGG